MASLSWSCQHLDSSAFALRLSQLESEEKHYAKTVLASSNSIHVIKEGAFLGFTKLESLQLGFNKLVTFPLAVCVLAETLVTLNISCNAITHLPEELGQLSQLKQLIVRENKLVNIPKSIGNLTKLQLFDAAKNRLEVIPNEFCRCKSILRLDLEQNRIRMLPWDFDRLSSIQILRLRDNPVPDYCGQNVASSVAVKALIQRFVAPLMLQSLL